MVSSLLSTAFQVAVATGAMILFILSVKLLRYGTQSRSENCKAQKPLQSQLKLGSEVASDPQRLNQRQKKKQKKGDKVAARPKKQTLHVKDSSQRRIEGSPANTGSETTEVNSEGNVHSEDDVLRATEENVVQPNGVSRENNVAQLVQAKITAVSTRHEICAQTLPADRQALLKESFKLSKKLREIAALEKHVGIAEARLDQLQAAKIEKKALLESRLNAITKALEELSPNMADSAQVHECCKEPPLPAPDCRGPFPVILSTPAQSFAATMPCLQRTSAEQANNVNECSQEDEVVHVYELDKDGKPVLKFTSSLSHNGTTLLCEEAQPESQPQSPTPDHSRLRSSPDVIYFHHEDMPIQDQQHVEQPVSLTPQSFFAARGTQVMVPALTIEERAEVVPHPPGLSPQTTIVDPGPPPGLDFPSSTNLCTPDVDDEATVEVHALLQSISHELNRVSFGFVDDFCDSPLDKLSSESEINTRDLSCKEANSPLAGQVSLPPVVDEATLAMGVWAHSSAMWDSLDRAALDMPSKSVDYGQYSMMLNDASMYEGMTCYDDHSSNAAGCWKPFVNYSAVLQGATLM